MRKAIVVLAMMMLAGEVLGQPKVDPFSTGSTTRPEAAKPAGVIASVEFVDAPVNTIFKMISDLTGWSIILSPEVSKQPPRINIWIKNLTPNEVLDQVCTLAGLTVERKNNVIQVLTFDEFAAQTGLEKRVITLKFASAKDVAQLARPFCEKNDQARLVADESTGRIILLMPRQRLDSAEKLIKTLDVPFEAETVRIVQLKYLDSTKIVPSLDAFLSKTSMQSAAGPRRIASTQDSDAASPGERWNVQFMTEPSLNIVVLRGSPPSVTKVAELIAQLDVQPDVRVASYELQYINARDAFATLSEVTRQAQSGGHSESRIRIACSETGNRIIVEGGQHEHERIAKIIEALDKPLPMGTGGSRIYRLENASSAEVAKVIDGLISESSAAAGKTRSPMKAYDGKTPGPGVRGISSVGPGAGAMPAPAGPAPSPTPGPAVAGGEASGDSPQGVDMVPPRVIDAPDINAVIVRASAAEHEELSRIIKELDKPRSQVILEVTLVTVRSDCAFDLGVELEGANLGGKHTQAVGFSSFGVGDANSKDGTLRLPNPPKFGGNVAVFDSNDYSLVINALKTVGDVRITSAPKVLAQDNAKAQISAINQEPYESTSQSQDSTLTSFGGFVDAGTTLSVLPHISEQNWLRLEYEIDQSSFGDRTVQQAAANLPPPRRQAFINGTVRIPAEHMIVVGGMVDTRTDNTQSTVPFVGDIPLLGELFKQRSKQSMKETLFIFIRPRVLRDENFKDLLNLSQKDIRRAKVDACDAPQNGMKMIISDTREDE